VGGLAGVLLIVALASSCRGGKGVDDPANELPFGHVDVPADGAQVNAVAGLAGWALDDRGVREIRVYVDGFLMSRGPLNNERPDVSKAYPKYAHAGNRHGWTLSMAFDGPGAHAVLVQAVDGNGASRDIGVMTVHAVDR
jgi:hypothetical protein